MAISVVPVGRWRAHGEFSNCAGAFDRHACWAGANAATKAVDDGVSRAILNARSGCLAPTQSRRPLDDEAFFCSERQRLQPVGGLRSWWIQAARQEPSQLE